ncbi:MAG: nuclear transport factor 2 family protein [Pseudomonadota bacterium]
MTYQPHLDLTDFPMATALPSAIVNPESARPLSGEDAATVRETVTRIYLAEDARDVSALKALVTDDFVQEHSVYGTLSGGDAFAGWVADNPAAFDRFRHMSMNTVTRASGDDGAEAVSYILVLELFPKPGEENAALPRILAHAVVRDRLVKANGRWRIAHRVYDQFAVPADIVPDRKAQLEVARTIAFTNHKSGGKQ